MLKDFNIKNTIEGVDKECIREFTAVIRNKTLEFRFHWTGKGTAAAPKRGTYGPLISAISVKSGKLHTLNRSLCFLLMLTYLYELDIFNL